MPRVLTYRERSKEPSRRVVEPKVVRRVSARRPPTFMDEPVMTVTEQHEVVEVGPPAPSPVHEVVGFSEVRAPATDARCRPGSPGGHRQTGRARRTHGTTGRCR